MYLRALSAAATSGPGSRVQSTCALSAATPLIARQHGGQCACGMSMVCAGCPHAHLAHMLGMWCGCGDAYAHVHEDVHMCARYIHVSYLHVRMCGWDARARACHVAAPCAHVLLCMYKCMHKCTCTCTVESPLANQSRSPPSPPPAPAQHSYLEWPRCTRSLRAPRRPAQSRRDHSPEALPHVGAESPQSSSRRRRCRSADRRVALSPLLG